MIDSRLGKLQRKILVATMFPVMIMGCMIVLFSMKRYESLVSEEVDNSLLTTAKAVQMMYDDLYPGDYVLVGDTFVSLYKGEKELTGDHALIDSMGSETGTIITLFYKDARILTTMVSENGARPIGTKLNDRIYKTMESKPAVAYYSGTIGDEEYYECYMPLINSDGTFIGIIGTGMPAATVKAKVRLATWPIFIGALLLMLVASLISIRYTTGMVKSIGDIGKFLSVVTSGKLDAVMNGQTIKRNDEIGDTAQAVVKMRDVLRIMVEKDPLTMLYNRRCGSGRFKKLQENAKRSGIPYCVVLGDIDFFKKVNDTYGHDAGDEVLKFVALELRRMMMGKGFAARWGGEEFLLVFDDSNIDETRKEMEEFLDRIRASVIHYASKEIRITMTFGILAGDPEEDMKESVKKVDEALYYGKENGRNRIIKYSDLTINESGKQVLVSEEKSDRMNEDSMDEFASLLEGFSHDRSSDAKSDAKSEAKVEEQMEDLIMKLSENVMHDMNGKEGKNKE